MAFLRSLKLALTPGFRARLAPDAPLAVVGDVHGRVDLLVDLVKMIAVRKQTVSTLVCVGDYIDRGERSAQALAYLRDLQQGGWPGEVICLKGNHESMMLAFLDRPEEVGLFWLHNGGAHTLASFGIDPGLRDMDALRDRLRERMPPGAEAWLRALPVSYRSGNVFVAHAGADPSVPVEQQDEAHLLWGHPEFMRIQRRDGIWVVHGHTIQENPSLALGRISIDTGAYATNRLTAALIDAEECLFVTT